MGSMRYLNFMRRMALIFLALFAGTAMAETVFEDFSVDAGTRWDFVADRVMGGVSSGQAEIIGLGPDAYMRLTGTVSTDNNGGFVQVRRRFAEPWPSGVQGIDLHVRGNGQTYYVFLKTPNLSRVWYSYRAAFVATQDWQTITLPFKKFKASNDAMPQSFDPSQVNSIAIVAYGNDYEADVSVRNIRLH